MKYCPKCRCEYYDTVEICADCGIPLGFGLPPEPKPEHIKYKELLFTYNPSDIAFLKSLFDANNIKYHIQGEHFLQIRPMAQPAGVMVNESQFNEARVLLKDFKPRFSGFAPRDDDRERMD